MKIVNKAELREKTKIFFRSQTWKNILVFLVFVALAFCFWVLQYFQQETKYDVSSVALIEKRLPVVINGTFSPATGCILADSLHIDPAVVWVYGDKNIVDTLQAIETVPVNQKNIRKKIDVTLRLVAPPHIRLSDDKVKITAEVEEYTEKLFELPVVCRRMPDNVHVRFFPSTVEVSCQVALKKYAELTDDDLEVSVDYRTLTQKQSINASLSLSKKPKGLVNYRIQPETVEFLIEQKKGL